MLTSYPYEFFNNIDDYQKPVNKLRKEEFFKELKNDCPFGEEIGRTKGISKLFINIKGRRINKIIFQD